MFRLTKKEEGIKWPVKISEPKSGGAVQEHTIYVYFIVKGQDFIDENIQFGDYEFLRQVIDPAKGWEGVTQEDESNPADSSDVPYSEEALQSMLQIPYVTRGFIDGYFNFIAGVSSKNSRTRRHTG